MRNNIGLLNLAIQGISVASVIAFSVCMYVHFGCVTIFQIPLQYNIRPPDCDVCALKFVARVNLRGHDTLPDPNCDVCAPKFAPGANLRRDDNLTRTLMNVMIIFQ